MPIYCTALLLLPIEIVTVVPVAFRAILPGRNYYRGKRFFTLLSKGDAQLFAFLSLDDEVDGKESADLKETTLPRSDVWQWRSAMTLIIFKISPFSSEHLISFTNV